MDLPKAIPLIFLIQEIKNSPTNVGRHMKKNTIFPVGLFLRTKLKFIRRVQLLILKTPPRFFFSQILHPHYKIQPDYSGE